jgi:opacity protein-like surface antigen
MRIPRYISFAALITLTGFAHAGFFGGGVSSNSSKSFDHRTDGFQVNFGSHISSVVDLEFNYVDFGTSSFDKPNFITPDPTDEDDNGSFENIGYGTTSSSNGGLKYTGISSLDTFGVSAGIKLRKNINSWLEVFARASFLAWESTTEEFELYSEREPLDDDGDTVDASLATNQTPCNTLDECRQPLESKKHQALDFWYGYGLIIKPASWLAIRTEYSIVTLNAVDFPKGVLEGLSASLEIHF